MDRGDLARIKHIKRYCEEKSDIWETSIRDIPNLLLFCERISKEVAP